MLVAVPAFTPESYQTSSLHGEGQIWAENNCYVDLCIDLVHAHGLCPQAMLGYAVAVDFEGDQWTFHKPQHNDLWDLYQLDIQELTCWRPLRELVREHLAAGKLICVEADAYYLPDVAATDYRQHHVKTSIAINAVDEERKRVSYFHNAGMFWLANDDYDALFASRQTSDGAGLPLYAEFVRSDRTVKRSSSELAQLALPMLARAIARLPARNPVAAFADRFALELPALQAAGLAYYHQWAFATTRQMGSAYALAAAHLVWLAEVLSGPDGNGARCDWSDALGPWRARVPALASVAAAYRTIAEGAKAFVLKGARAVNGRKPLDMSEPFAQWAQAWQHAAETLRAFPTSPAR